MRKTLCWIITIIITLAASAYQRITGPTHPTTLKTAIANRNCSFSLPRSCGESDCIVKLTDVPEGTKASIFWRNYPSNDRFQEVPMSFDGTTLKGALPQQPRAGKLEYFVSIDGKEYFADKPLVIRFKGDVPATLLIVHIILMFASMLLACYGGIMALLNNPVYKRYFIWTGIVLFAGGFILGPIVQWYAFGSWWSGIPFGWDLTDNKTLIVMLIVLATILTQRLRANRMIAIIAAVAFFIVFLLPHSLGGSELNRQTGVVETKL